MSWFDKLFGEENDSNEDYLNNRNKRRQKANQSDEQDTLLPQNNDVYDRPRGKFRFPMRVVEEAKHQDADVDHTAYQSSGDTHNYRDESQTHKQIDNKRHRRRREDVSNEQQRQTKNGDARKHDYKSNAKKSHISIQTEVLRAQSSSKNTEHSSRHSDFRASEVPSAIFGTKKRRQLKNGVIPSEDEADTNDDSDQQNEMQQETESSQFQTTANSEATENNTSSNQYDADIATDNFENDIQADDIEINTDSTNTTPKTTKKDNTININNFYASQIVEEIRRERERKVLKKRQFKKALQQKRQEQDDAEKDSIQKAIDEMYAKQAQQYIGDSSLVDNDKQTQNDDTTVEQETQNNGENDSLHIADEENHFKYEEVDLSNVSDVHTVQDEDVEVNSSDSEASNTIESPQTSEENSDDIEGIAETADVNHQHDDSVSEHNVSDAEYREIGESQEEFTNEIAEPQNLEDDRVESDEDNTTLSEQQSVENNATNNSVEDKSMRATTSNMDKSAYRDVNKENQNTTQQSQNTSNNKNTAVKKSAKPFNVVMTPSDKKRMMDARKAKSVNVPNLEPEVSSTSTNENKQEDVKNSDSINEEYNDSPTLNEDAITNETTEDNQDVESLNNDTSNDMSEVQNNTDNNQDQLNKDSEQQSYETRTIRRGPSLKLPDVSLLERPEEHEIDNSWIEEKKQELNDAFYYFNVPAEVQSVTEGPSVTRFELSVEKGVKVSRITALQDDIKMALAAKDIRIEAPIPGTSLVGIEVPNQSSTKVNIRSIIDTEEFRSAESKLTVAMGYRINNKPLLMDIAKTPHALIAGATGSGKSVCINSILLSLIYKNHPEELKLLLIDPKMVELAPYNDLPHLVSPVITDVKAATQSLKWAVEEMERRYKLFAKYHVRNITAFNKKANYEDRMPKIVIVIDELADLMMMAPQDVEQSIARIAQKARACGIHMLVATQRPSVNVITGLIKANIPTRIAFMVSSSVDSRTILDSGGAERLLGYGDMLYLGSGMNKPIRVQGTFVSDEEIDDVVDFVKQQRDPEYLFEEKELLKKTESAPQDDLFNDVCNFMVQEGHISTSLIQRHFQIGYNRAARIVDQLEQLGYISESNGSKPRDVYLTETDLNELNK